MESSLDAARQSEVLLKVKTVVDMLDVLVTKLTALRDYSNVICDGIHTQTLTLPSVRYVQYLSYVEEFCEPLQSILDRRLEMAISLEMLEAQEIWKEMKQ